MSVSLQKTSFAPKYVGLARTLLRQIAKEGLVPGDRLGTEVELGHKHGVSRVTVRQALSMLEREGYISRQKARGTFVTRGVAQSQQLNLVRGFVVVVCSNEQAAHMDEDFAFATLLRRLERTLARQGFSVTLVGVGEDKLADRARLEHLAQREDLQGVCAIGPCFEPYRDLLGQIPVVNSACFYSDTPPLVRQDVVQVVEECVAHALEHGHREIAMLCGPWIDQRSFGMFAEGYRRAFETASLPFRRTQLHHAYPGESLTAFVDAALSAQPRATAVFAENWRVCQAVLGVTKERGMTIPQDLSVIGYGQNILQLPSPVGLTTYVPDSEGIGETVAELLTRIVDGADTPSEPVNVSGKLLVRDSVRRLAPTVAEGGKT